MRVTLYTMIAALLAGGGFALSQARQMVSITRDISTDGAIRLVIQNNYSEPLTAFAYDASWQSNGNSLYEHGIVDLLTLPRGTPIPSGGKTTTARSIGGAGTTNAQMLFKAAIFADGQTFGDAACIKRIIQRRQYTFDETIRIDKMLRDAVTNGLDIEAVADQARSDKAQRLAAAQGDIDHIKPIADLWNLTIHVLDSARQTREQSSHLVNGHLSRLNEIRERLERSLPALKKSDN